VCAVTATRDRRSDPAQDDAEPAWDDRPIIGAYRGWPWWACVASAFGLAAIAAVIDMQLQGSLGKIYQGAYILGCVGAVCWVRRRSLFGPIVQPPLVFAVTAVIAVIALGDNSSSGLRQKIISAVLPLTSNFPTMAIATGVTVAVGLYRLWKERDPNPPVRANIKKDRPTREPRPRDQESPRRRGERVPPEARRGGRPRDPEEQDARGSQRARPSRPRGEGRDQGSRDRGSDRRDRGNGPSERGTGDRQSRPNRSRDQDPPPRRRDSSEPRPRRDDRSTPRREPGDRGGPRPPRRRPPESYR
jgi:hypothetical protein